MLTDFHPGFAQKVPANMHSPPNGDAARANWDDLRFVLAVAETGSVSAAARALGVNHATVLRRIAAFEQAQGAQVFDRGPQGYTVPSDRLRVIDAAREAAAAIETVHRLVRGADPQLNGTVRVTSTDSMCMSVLPAILGEIARAARGLRIDLISTNAHLDLARLGADISVRPAAELPDDLTGEPAGEVGFAVYAVPGAPEDRWLGLRGMLMQTPVATALAPHAAQIVAGADSLVVLREMAAAGLGRAILPCSLGEGDARLQRFGPPIAGLRVPIWVATHRDLADSPRLRRLRRSIAEALLRRRRDLTGPGPD